MDLEARKRFAQAVVDLRAGRDLRSFAKEVGVKHPTIIDWEGCKTIPKTPSLERIALLRGETLDQFMDYIEGKQSLTPSDRLMALVSGASREQLSILLRAIAARLDTI